MAKAFKSFFSGLFSSGSRRQSQQSNCTEGGDYKALPESSALLASSRVYRGRLNDGAQIAVKKLKHGMYKDIKDFCEAAQFLGKFKHKNLLCLRGYCAEGQERILVFDYMQNSSLHAHLHGDLQQDGKLSWQKRMEIAVGCAEGLAYLHHHSNPHLVHGDIKSTNVLLSSDMQPRIVDFGMKNFLKDGIPKPRGAFGYAAPEDLKGEDDLTMRSDVFSFGILLLELISGKSPSEKISSESGKLSIVEWAQNLIVAGKLDELIDPRLNGDYVLEELEMLLNVAVLCSQDKPENRVSMLEVLTLIDGVVKNV